MKSELFSSREATNASRAERAVMRYFRVRIGVRGDAHQAPPSASTPFRRYALQKNPLQYSFFLFGGGYFFGYGKGFFLEVYLKTCYHYDVMSTGIISQSLHFNTSSARACHRSGRISNVSARRRIFHKISCQNWRIFL